MSTFPLLHTGAVTQYPSGRRLSYVTSVTRFLDGTEQRFRELNQPVRRWMVRLHHLTAAEIRSVEAFFEDMQGQFASFVFVDPWDGTEYPECSFDQDVCSIEAVDEMRNQGYLVIRNNSL
jgi:hypothetical protein